MTAARTRWRARARAAATRPLRLARRAMERRRDDRLDRAIVARTDLVPTTRSEPEDVFVVGYPKSGNTWVQTLAAGLVYGIDCADLPGRLVHALVPDVHLWRYYVRWRTPMVFKSHHLPRPGYRRVVYLIRDGRDALCSYAHHCRALGQEPDLLHMVRTGEGLSNGRKWHEHVEAWRENPFGAEVMTMSYEGLQADPVRELRRLCSFIGLERTEERLRSVAASATFESMRRQEARHGWPEWPKDRFFVRRGEVGSYRDEMAPEVLEAFEREAWETLRRFGYAGADGSEGPRAVGRARAGPSSGARA